jgi:hypothetical protein
MSDREAGKQPERFEVRATADSHLWGGSFEKIAGVTTEGRQTPLYAVAIALIFVGTFAFVVVLLRLV